MNNETWVLNTFFISENCSTHGFSRKQVSGVTNNGFGVHEKNGAWTITHLKSGWRCYACKSEESAAVIGEYLIRNYATDFADVTVSGNQVENAKLLRKKVRADKELNRLTKSFAYSENEMRKLDLIPSVNIEFIS